MAVKSSDQITIVDITDAYSVSLTADSFTIAGDLNGHPLSSTTLTTTVQAYKGTEELTASSVSIGTISTITGVTSSKSGLTITFTVQTTCTGGVITIPITVDGDVEFEKKVSIAIAKTGATGAQGAKGDTGDKGDKGDTGAKGDQGNPGVDAILVTITSDNGVIFKNATGNTTLTAHVFVGGIEKTISAAGVVDGGLGSIYWYKDGTKVSAASKTITIAASAVATKMVIDAKLEA